MALAVGVVKKLGGVEDNKTFFPGTNKQDFSTGSPLVTCATRGRSVLSQSLLARDMSNRGSEASSALSRQATGKTNS